jgi:large subunit ribosomal protein L19
MTTANITVSPVNMAERKALPFGSGDIVKVFVKVEEKGKTRLQAFEGTVIARKGGSQPGATFTVRRVSGGYGVEKIFPLYSPLIDKIEIIRHSRTRRSKLYNIRDMATRQIRRQMRKIFAIKDMPAVEEETPVMDEEVSGVVSVSMPEETNDSQPTTDNTEEVVAEAEAPAEQADDTLTEEVK